MHKTLDRQLRGLDLDPATPPDPEQWQLLLERIDRSYVQADQDRYTLERSLTISSQEMQELYDELRASKDQELREEQQRQARALAVIHATLEAALAGVLVVDDRNRIIHYNQRFCEMWSLPSRLDDDDERVLASVADQVVNSEAFVERIRYLYAHPDITSRDELEFRDGRIIDRYSGPVRLSDGRISGRVWFFSDVTKARRAQQELELAQRQMEIDNEELERRVRRRTAELVRANRELRLEIAERKRTADALQLAEEKLRHSQKMEAIGRLAGGVAHDFNNMLAVVISYADLILRGLDASNPVAEDVQEIRRAGKRAAALTQQLLAFGRQQVLQPRRLDLNQCVEDVGRMLGRLIGEHIELKIHVAPEVGPVLLDPGQLEQVLMNLAVNARDAMPNGGELTIETDRVDQSEAPGRSFHGRLAVLRVRDTGIGMAPETIERIFEPFFTTKPKGKGTGLGLATAYGIIKQSGGDISVRSRLGAGTTFEIFFPEVSSKPEASPRTSLRVARSLEGRETILLVEDDPSVRAATRRLLEQHGYKVLEATNGKLALEAAEREQGPIHLLISDVVMPEMSGPELSRRLSRSRQELRVLLMSGYASGEIELERGTAFINKPFDRHTFTSMVRDLLEGVDTRAVTHQTDHDLDTGLLRTPVPGAALRSTRAPTRLKRQAGGGAQPSSVPP